MSLLQAEDALSFHERVVRLVDLFDALDVPRVDLSLELRCRLPEPDNNTAGHILLLDSEHGLKHGVECSPLLEGYCLEVPPAAENLVGYGCELTAEVGAYPAEGDNQ